MKIQILLVFASAVLSNCYQSQIRDLAEASYSAAGDWAEVLLVPTDATRIIAHEQTGGLQYLDLFYAFSVKPARVEPALKDICALCEKRMRRKYIFTRSTASPLNSNWPNWAKSAMPWWNPDTISNGIYLETQDSHDLQIWADRNTGRIFIYQSD